MSNNSKKRLDFLKHAQDFLICHSELGKVWDSIKTTLNHIPYIDDIEIKSNQSGFYDICYQQIEQYNLKSITSILQLFDVAKLAKPIFDDIISDVVISSGLTSRNVIFVPIKSQESSIDKADFNYISRKPGPSISWLYDMIRVSIVCENEEEICAIVESLKISNDLTIIRLKNRFNKPIFNGYRDILINVKINIQDNCYHICEIQLHYKSIYNKSIEIKSHLIYEYYRTFFRSNRMNLSIRDIELRYQLLERINSISLDLNKYVNNYISEGNLSLLDPLQQVLRRMAEYNFAEKVQRYILNKQLIKCNNNLLDERVLMAKHNLILILEQLDSYVEAESLCNELIDQYEQLSLTNYDHEYKVMKLYTILSNILMKQKKYLEAEKILNKLLIYKEKLTGFYHPSTLSTLDNLADIYKQLEKYNDSERICRKTINIRETLYGLTNPKTISSMNNLAVILLKLGDYNESENLFKKVIDIKKSLYNNDHNQSILSTYDNLAYVYDKLMKYADSEQLYSHSLNVRINLLGDLHIDTIANMISLGNISVKLNKLIYACHYFYLAYQSLFNLYGNDNNKTKQAREKAVDTLTLSNRDIKVFNNNDARLHIDINMNEIGKGRSFIKATNCENCNNSYTLLNREHHCRVCYRSVCGNCSSMSSSISKLLNTNKKERLCTKCYLAVKIASSDQTS